MQEQPISDLFKKDLKRLISQYTYGELTFAEAIGVIEIAKEMNPGEKWEFDMESVEQAHSEYVQLKKEMKKKNFYSTPAKKCLNVSRNGSVLIIEMGRPNPYPTPRKVLNG